MNVLEELQKLAAEKKDVNHLWKNWKDSGEEPEHFQPLVNQFKPMLNTYTIKFSRTAAVPKTAISAQAHKQFLAACRSFNPEKAQLATHVTNYLKNLDRFVGEYANTGKIPEPRRHMINQFNTSRESLHEELDRQPTYEEIAKHMNEQRSLEGKKFQVKPGDLQKLETELSRKDLSEEMTLEEPEHWKSPVEEKTIVMLHYSTPIDNGLRHQYRLTKDEHEIFRRIHPLEEGSLNYDKSMKLKDIAKELSFSAPKVSRSLKSINKKIKFATQYAE